MLKIHNLISKPRIILNEKTNSVYLDGYVERGEIDCESVRAAVEKIKEQTIDIYLNSPGGDVFEGIAIANYIKELEKQGIKVNIIVYGLAASIASVIAVAASYTKMLTGTKLMIHNPWSVCCGDAEEMRETASILDDVKNSVLEFYQLKSIKNLGTEKQIDFAKFMEEETWFTPEEALTIGLCDEIEKVKIDNNESIITNPSNNDVMAKFTALNAEAYIPTIRVLENNLRLMGLSKIDAKLSAAAVFKTLKNRREADDLTGARLEKLKAAIAKRNIF